MVKTRSSLSRLYRIGRRLLVITAAVFAAATLQASDVSYANVTSTDGWVLRGTDVASGQTSRGIEPWNTNGASFEEVRVSTSVSLRNRARFP